MSIKVKLKRCDGPCGSEAAHIWKNDKGKRYCQNCWNKIKPKEEPTPNTSFPKFTPIPKQSDKRKKEDVLYKTMRIQFLKDYPICFMQVPGQCTTNATDVQHKKGRGKYYLDMRYWGPACRACHSYADTHPEEAFANGWAIPRLTKEDE